MKSSLPSFLPALTLWGLALGSTLCWSVDRVPPGLSCLPMVPPGVPKALGLSPPAGSQSLARIPSAELFWAAGAVLTPVPTFLHPQTCRGPPASRGEGRDWHGDTNAEQWVHPNSLPGVELGGARVPQPCPIAYWCAVPQPCGVASPVFPPPRFPPSHCLGNPDMVVQCLLQGDVTLCALPMLGVPSRGD